MKTNVGSKNRFPEFQKRFNELRGSMSQKDFAKKIGVSTPTVGFYENGERVPDALTLLMIADTCNVSVDYLLGRAECKTADNESIRNVIGLSDEAIDQLRSLSAMKVPKYVYISAPELLSEIITYRAFKAFIHEMITLHTESKNAIKNLLKYVKATNEDFKRAREICEEYGLIPTAPNKSIESQKARVIDYFEEIIFHICGGIDYHNEFKRTAIENIQNKAIKRSDNEKGSSMLVEVEETDNGEHNEAD